MPKVWPVMANPSARRGSQFESDVVSYIRSTGVEAERLTKTGKEDEGDLTVRLPTGLWVLELKAERPMNISGALREAELEALHYAKHRGRKELPHYAAVLKAPGKPISSAYVVQFLEHWLEAR